MPRRSSTSLAVVLLAPVVTAGSAGCAPAPRCPPATAAAGASIEPDVRAFMLAVEGNVSSKGPSAWQAAFADDRSFFMAVNGRLVFPDRATATAAIGGLGRSIRRIELRWGSDLRVDALTPALAVVACSYWETRTSTDDSRVEETGYFTGVVERRGDRWQLRDAHWSVADAPRR